MCVCVPACILRSFSLLAQPLRALATDFPMTHHTRASLPSPSQTSLSTKRSSCASHSQDTFPANLSCWCLVNCVISGHLVPLQAFKLTFLAIVYFPILPILFLFFGFPQLVGNANTLCASLACCLYDLRPDLVHPLFHFYVHIPCCIHRFFCFCACTLYFLSSTFSLSLSYLSASQSLGLFSCASCHTCHVLFPTVTLPLFALGIHHFPCLHGLTFVSLSVEPTCSLFASSSIVQCFALGFHSPLFFQPVLPHT